MEQSNKLSERLVQFVGIVFAVVVAESFVRYSSLIMHPATSPLGFVGLLAVYLTIISSWVRYHRSALEYPYKGGQWGWFRFGSDFIIVAAYAYLLYSLDATRQHSDVVAYLWGFAFIFFAYIFVGIFRIKEQDNPKASNLWRLALLFCCFFVVAAIYDLVLPVFYPTLCE